MYYFSPKLSVFIYFLLLYKNFKNLFNSSGLRGQGSNKGCSVHSCKPVATLSIFSSSTHLSSYNLSLFSSGWCIFKKFPRWIRNPRKKVGSQSASQWHPWNICSSWQSFWHCVCLLGIDVWLTDIVLVWSMNEMPLVATKSLVLD